MEDGNGAQRKRWRVFPHAVCRRGTFATSGGAVGMIRLFSATLLSLLLCASLANAAEKPLIVASDATWPPIEMLDENKNVVGYSIDYLKAVAKEAGLNVEFRNTAWDGIFRRPGIPSGRHHRLFRDHHRQAQRRLWASPILTAKSARPLCFHQFGPQKPERTGRQEGRRPDRLPPASWRPCPRPSPKPSSRRTTKWASPSKTSPRATSTQ